MIITAMGLLVDSNASVAATAQLQLRLGHEAWRPVGAPLYEFTMPGLVCECACAHGASWCIMVHHGASWCERLR